MSSGHYASLILDLDLGGLWVAGGGAPHGTFVTMHGRSVDLTVRGTPEALIRWRDEVANAVEQAVAEDIAHREAGA